MATKFKCNDGIYTVLRNGRAVAIGATAGEAITAISTDAVEIVCCSIEITGITAGQQGVSFLVNAEGSSLNMCYDFNNGAVTGCTGCQSNNGVIVMEGIIAQYFSNPLGIELTFYSSVDGCRSYCASAVINNHVRLQTIPTGGGDTVVSVPAGAPACTGTTLYVQLAAIGISGATLNTSTGAVTVPAQAIGGTGAYYYYKLCDGLVTGILALVLTNP